MRDILFQTTLTPFLPLLLSLCPGGGSSPTKPDTATGHILAGMSAVTSIVLKVIFFFIGPLYFKIYLRETVGLAS